MYILRKIWVAVAVALGSLALASPATAALSYTFNSQKNIALSSPSYTASGALTVALGFAPAPGTVLTVVENTGLKFINGKFDNVPQGGIVSLSYGGKTYNFVANYYGGNGRSLVLQWRTVGLAAWGNNANGQLGDNLTATRPIPATVSLLADKTVLSVAGGSFHSLALTSEGKVYAWGGNIYGQLGDNSHAERHVPVAVGTDLCGPLAGKTVVAIAAGAMHSLALTSDGIVYSWGSNGVGQLGIGSTTDSLGPVPVNAAAWSGKTVVAIAAGYKHSLAITSDGKVYAWGSNIYGQFGNGGTDSSLVPVLAIESLSGLPVLAVAAGANYNLALNFNKQVYAWGYNDSGQLGDGTTTQSSSPVAVDATAWSGKTAIAVAAGDSHSLALTRDGLVFAWGSNEQGQLGVNETTQSSVPVAVPLTGTPVAIAAGSQHSMAVISDGGAYVWGSNSNAQLGRSGSTSPVPTRVALGALQGKTPVLAITGGAAHTLAIVGSSVTVHPANRTVAEDSSVSFTAAADLAASTVQWQIGPAGSSGPFFNLGVTTETLTLPYVKLSQSGIAYRAVFTNSNTGAVSITAAATLTVVKGQRDLLAIFTSGSDIALTADSIYVSGSLTTALAFAPTPGTNLTVIKNTGTSFIGGVFDNVPQGGTVALTYNGVTYNYIANYYGGNGRSLVLQWPCTGVATWGYNYGSESVPIQNAVPVAVPTGELMAGKTVVAVSGGGGCGSHSLALTSDGKVFAWGENYYGQLGIGSNDNSSVPVAVGPNDVFAQKTVVAVAAGGLHSLALTSSGEIFAWGYNCSGQLGNDSSSMSVLPVAVNASGALAGKTVVAIAAGMNHSLALTSDGQVAAWGENIDGQLGFSGASSSAVPVSLSNKGVLLGKTVVAIAAGMNHSLALTSDGQLIAWGDNGYGQLGNGLGYNLWTPVAVDMTGALAGKKVTAIAGGGNHSLALTEDGMVFGWGRNESGQLGNIGGSYCVVPLNIDDQGAWQGKTVTAIGAGYGFSSALTSDGRVFSWGENYFGELGNNSMENSSVPVPVDTAGPLNGKAVLAIAPGSRENIALFAYGAPSVTSNPISQRVTSGAAATFTTAATSGGYPFTIQWQQSWTGPEGLFKNIEDNPTATTGTLVLPKDSWAEGSAYRAVFTNAAGSSTTPPVSLTMVNGHDLQTLFTSGTGIALEADSLVISGSLEVCLAFAPAPGTNLTVIRNNGPAFISGTFDNLPQGGTVSLTFGGKTYNYIANYYGGNGRSLVLQSTCVGLGGWGEASRYALGYADGIVPEPIVVKPVEAMAGKTIVAVAGGDSYSLALTAEGKVFAWGYNEYGQLGINTTMDSSAPQAVGGALADKTVVAIAAAKWHSLALTSEGQVYAWGSNYRGQLGNGTTTDYNVPVPVDISGALAGKTVVAISAGNSNSLALTSDGKIFAWGSDGTTASPAPVEINTGGAMAGKTAVAIAAGVSFNLALTADGKVFAWGRNTAGQLGNGTQTDSSDPVAVDATGALNGKKVVAIAIGRSFGEGHSLALTSDGLVFAWGENFMGALGNGAVDGWMQNSSVPVAVRASGEFEGKTVTAIAAGEGYSMALTSEGHVFTWGSGFNGELGNLLGNSPIPMPVSKTGALAGKAMVSIAAGFHHNLALFGLNPPEVTANPADLTCSPVKRSVFTAEASDFPAITTIQWQVSKTGTAGVFSDIEYNLTATTGTLDLGYDRGIPNGTAYRAVFINHAGTAVSKAASLFFPPPVITTPEDMTVSATNKNGAAISYLVTAVDDFDGGLPVYSAPSPCLPFPIGTTTVYCSATNSRGLSSSASFKVTVLRTYDAFQDEHGIAFTNPTEDPCRTGVPNLAAYAFGVDPTAPDRSRLPLLKLQDGHLQISYSRWKDAGDLDYIVEVSSDLQNWTSGTGCTQEVSVTPMDGDPAREQVLTRDLTPALDAPHRFIRVRIAH